MRILIWMAVFVMLFVGSLALTGCHSTILNYRYNYLPHATLTVEVDKPDDWEESDDVGRFTDARITNRFSRTSIDAPVKLGSVRDEGDTLIIDVILDTNDTLDGYEDIEFTDIYGERHDAIAR